MSITKTFKGYQCQISKTPIFWTINSIDKPSKQFFNSYVKWEDVNFTPNFIDQFTVNIVADSDKYTLLKVSEKYETVDGSVTSLSYENQKIFINSNVSKILKKGYLLNFDLDIFATYFYDLSDYLKDINCYVKVNRLFNYKIMETDYIESVIWKNDPILDYSDCGYIPVNKLCTKWDSTNEFTSCVYVMGAMGPDTTKLTMIYNYNTVTVEYTEDETTRPHSRKMLVYMYQLENGSYFGFCETGEPNKNVFTYKLKDNFHNTVTDYYPYPAHMLHAFIQKNVDWLQNKFLGIWTIDWLEYTNILYLFNCHFFKNKNTTDTWNVGTNAVVPTLFFQPNEYIELNATLSKKDIEIKTDIPIDITKPNNTISINDSNDVPNYYVLAKCPYENWGVPYLNPWLSWQNRGIITFNGDTFNFYYKNDRDRVVKAWTSFNYKYCDIKSWYSTMSVAISSYSEYINSVKSTQNTNLQIAKQQSTMGIVGNVLSGVTGIASAVMSGNVIGGINSLTNSTMGIANNILKYQNTQKKIDAENEDKYRVAKANNINSNSVTDDIMNKLNLYLNNEPSYVFSEIFNIKFPNKIQTIQMNRLIGKYGFYIGQDLIYSDIEDSITPENDSNNIYTIIDFEIDELILKQFLPNENVELINAIKIILNNSLRIWTKYMDINTRQYFSLPESY